MTYSVNVEWSQLHNKQTQSPISTYCTINDRYKQLL